MTIAKGLMELAAVNKGDDEVRCVNKGNTAIFVSNAAPSQHVISSSSAGSANDGVSVTFTSTVTDDDLTSGVYAWTGGSGGAVSNTHPDNTYASTGSNQTRNIQCIFTDMGGEAITSNTIAQQWRAPLLSRNFSAGPPLSFAGGGRAGVGGPSIPASEVGFGNAIVRVDCPGFFDVTFIEGTGYVNFSGSDTTTDYSAPSGSNFSVSRFAGTAGTGSIGWSIGANATHLSGSGSITF